MRVHGKFPEPEKLGRSARDMTRAELMQAVYQLRRELIRSRVEVDELRHRVRRTARAGVRRCVPGERVREAMTEAEQEHWHEWAPGVRFRIPRHPNAISPEKAKRILVLEREGLPRVTIAERLLVHVNTVTKYLRLAGRPLLNRGRRASKARAGDAH